jgi:RNA methyltransferase, TrmH family
VIKELKQRLDFLILASTLDDALALSQSFEPKFPVAIIMGNEGQGVSQKLIGMSDAKVKIEMQGFESLNVAVAAGIFCYHFKK